MAAAPLPADELARLATLRKYDVLDTPPEQAFDDAVKLASVICGTPIALVALIDESRQWFKARVGLDATETPRDMAFCAHAILDPENLLVVPDASLDPRFADNPLVTGTPDIRFYAGAPLISPSGHAMGTLCVIDSTPREIDADKRAALAAIARTVASQLELRRVSHELSIANDHLRTLSFIDPLTGVANRRALEARLAEEIARAARHDSPLSMVMLDIDHFKTYNDSFGHVLGDDVLVCFAELIKMDMRQTDLVARYGGEEFVVLLPETTLEGARMLAERYRLRVESTNFPGQKITTSVGVSVWQPRFERPEQFIDAVDQALYAAKRAGRNRVEVAQEFHPGH